MADILLYRYSNGQQKTGNKQKTNNKQQKTENKQKTNKKQKTVSRKQKTNNKQKTENKQQTQHRQQADKRQQTTDFHDKPFSFNILTFSYIGQAYLFPKESSCKITRSNIGLHRSKNSYFGGVREQV